MFNSVLGPVRGLFIATFACPVGEMGQNYLGYFKVYAQHPDCYCKQGELHHGCASGTWSGPETAQHHAALQAHQWIAGHASAAESARCCSV